MQPDTFLDKFGRFLAKRLVKESSGYEPYTPSDPETLRRTLEPGDILLIEGNQRISAAIKYLTQSTWSHSALYVGDALPDPGDGTERPRLIEVL
ncbi:lipo-like protein, partial [Rhizobiaceae sp. 2RAB30]